MSPPSSRARAPPVPGPALGVAGALCLAVQPIAMNLISVPALAYIIRRLGPTAYGQWATASGLILLVTPLTNLGLRGPFIRAVARDPAQASRLTAEQLGLRLLASAIAALAAVLFARALDYPGAVLARTAIAGAAMTLSSVALTATDLFQATGRLPTVAALAMVYGLVLTAASVVVVWAGAGPVGLACAYLLGPATWVGLSVWLIHRHDFPVRLRWDFRRFGMHLRDARYLAAQQLAATLARHADTLAAPFLLGMARYGIYSAGMLLPDRLLAIPDGLATALYPKIASQRDSDPAEASRDVGRFLALALVLCLPLSVLSAFLAEPIARVLFPRDAALCCLVIRITVWALPIAGIDLIMAYALNAAGREASQMRVVVRAAALTFPTSLALIAAFGLPGACVAALLRHPVCALLRLPEFGKTVGTAVAEIPVARIAVCNGLLLLVLFLVHPTLWSLGVRADVGAGLEGAVPRLALILVEAALGLAAYALAALALGLVGGTERGGGRFWRRWRARLA